MPDLPLREGLTMPRGIFKTAAKKEEDRVAEFSYKNESLAQMIVYAWTDASFKTQLLADAKPALEQRGIYLKKPVVITEADYYGGYHLTDPDGVVFVLPNQPRTATPPTGQTLLETAKLLMACTPNGI
jgi:hypothetical protein